MRKNGEIEEGRGLEARGAHTRGKNSTNLGIALTGNFEENIPTKEQYKSLAKLIKWLKEKYGDIPVTGHREHNNTSCPGENFYWEELERELKELEKENKGYENVSGGQVKLF